MDTYGKKSLARTTKNTIREERKATIRLLIKAPGSDRLKLSKSMQYRLRGALGGETDIGEQQFIRFKGGGSHRRARGR